jgi:hypothetical protein
MRPENLPVIERALDLAGDSSVLHPQSERPPGRLVFLRLHCPEPRDDVRRLAETTPRDVLIPKSPFGNRRVR